MDLHQLGVAVAAAHLAGLPRGADRQCLASRVPGPTAGQHHHDPGMFDAGHCWSRARQAGLLDHYHHVQRQEQNLREAHRWARQARRYATWALWSSGVGVLLAAIVLLMG